MSLRPDVRNWFGIGQTQATHSAKRILLQCHWRKTMVALTQQEQQIISSFRALDPQRRRLVLLEMARADVDGWKRFQAEAEARLREQARKKGVDWDQLNEQQRQDFIEDLNDSEAA
jgi:hypothetical protein